MFPDNSNQTTVSKAKSAPWYKNYMITIFVIGLPAFVVVACIFFVVFAVKHKDATVRDDWYMDGKTLYQDISKDQLAYDLGASGVLRFDGDNVRFELKFANAEQQLPKTLNVRISHATEKDKDRDFVLTHTADNVYQGQVSLDPNKGKYYLHINSDEQNWRLTQKQLLPAQNVVFAPLPAFDEHNLTLPDQRHKRSQETPSTDTGSQETKAPQ